MHIERKIRLNNMIYYIRVELEYKVKGNDNVPFLCIKNFENDYFDNGVFSRLIGFVEKKYSLDSEILYDKNISYMADILYMYDRISFLC